MIFRYAFYVQIIMSGSDGLMNHADRQSERLEQDLQQVRRQLHAALVIARTYAADRNALTLFMQTVLQGMGMYRNLLHESMTAAQLQPLDDSVMQHLADVLLDPTTLISVGHLTSADASLLIRLGASRLPDDEMDMQLQEHAMILQHAHSGNLATPQFSGSIVRGDRYRTHDPFLLPNAAFDASLPLSARVRAIRELVMCSPEVPMPNCQADPVVSSGLRDYWEFVNEYQLQQEDYHRLLWHCRTEQRHERQQLQHAQDRIQQLTQCLQDAGVVVPE